MPNVNLKNNSEANKTTKNLPRQQRLAVVFLAILAILIIVLWAVQFSAKLTRPFGIDKNSKTNSGATSTATSLKDSDGDGLTDTDEINVYKTSPYLEDSDSDGIADKQEILQGTDPNCPKGKDCNASVAPIVSSTTGSMISDSTTTSEDTNNGSAVTPDNSGVVTPATLRQILLQNGYDKATLDKISDEDIMKSYQEAIKNQNNSGTTNSNTINQ